MALKNYTTTIAVERTVAEIERLLVSHGATGVQKRYERGRLQGLAFTLNTPRGERAFELPACVMGTARALAKARGYRSIESMPERHRFGLLDQAHRTAWRNVKDWIDAQLALVATEQAAVDEIMLPYMLVGETETGEPLTLYGQFTQQALPAPGREVGR